METYNQANEVLNHTVANAPALIAANRACVLWLIIATATAMATI
jgi:hypothetical protein